MYIVEVVWEIEIKKDGYDLVKVGATCGNDPPEFAQTPPHSPLGCKKAGGKIAPQGLRVSAFYVKHRGKPVAITHRETARKKLNTFYGIDHKGGKEATEVERIVEHHVIQKHEVLVRAPAPDIKGRGEVAHERYSG
ncbi:hypothetical protein ES703_02839 [subsurface metagenome]